MTAQFGYGQLEPDDASSQYGVLQFIVEQLIANRIRTMVLVQVTASKSSNEVAAPTTVDVQPLVNQIDGNGNSTPHGTIYGIPVLRAGNIIADPKVGDKGIMIVADRDISAVKASNGALGNPELPGRLFDLADGVYIGALFGAAPLQYLRFTSTGLELVDKNGNKITTGATGMTLTDSNTPANKIEMKAGIVNVTTISFQVNGIPVTVP